MRKLDLYLGKTVASMMCLASAGLVSLLVIFTFLDQLADIKNDYTLLTVIQYVSYSTPRMFYETLPYAVLIGSLTGLGLLASSSELMVMRVAGVSTWQITLATLKPALLFVGLGLLIGETVLPGFERTARVIREDAMEYDITPQGGFWHREDDVFMQFGAVSHTGELKNINQYFLAEDQALIKMRWAERAHYTPAGDWVMSNVVDTWPASNKPSEKYDNVPWETSLTPNLINTEILVEPDKMSIIELYDKMSYLKGQGLNAGKFELGFWTKILQPLASLSLVFIAISFIFGPLRETTMGMRVVSGLVIGIMFKFVQDLLSPASLVFGFPPIIATTIPILICIGIGFYLLKRAN